MRSERLGAQTRLCLSVSPFHLHVSTTQVCAPSRDFPPSRPSSVTPPKGMSWTLTRPLSEWGPQCPSSPHRSKSRRGDTVLLANAGVQKGSGLSINDGFTVQYAHVARGVAKGGGGNSVPHGARWRRPSMRFFNGGAERGALGGLAGGVPSRSPTRSRRGQNGGDGRRRRDGGHFWFTTSHLPQSPDSFLPTREQGCRGCRGCRRQSQSSSRQALFSTTPLLSAGPDACQAPSPFRHGGSLGETEKRTEVALRRRSAAQTTLCCPT